MTPPRNGLSAKIQEFHDDVPLTMADLISPEDMEKALAYSADQIAWALAVANTPRMTAKIHHLFGTPKET